MFRHFMCHTRIKKEDCTVLMLFFQVIEQIQGFLDTLEVKVVIAYLIEGNRKINKHQQRCLSKKRTVFTHFLSLFKETPNVMDFSYIIIPSDTHRNQKIYYVYFETVFAVVAGIGGSDPGTLTHE